MTKHLCNTMLEMSADTGGLEEPAFRDHAFDQKPGSARLSRNKLATLQSPSLITWMQDALTLLQILDIDTDRFANSQKRYKANSCLI